MLKTYLYILIFIGLLFPEFKGIFGITINLNTYVLVAAGVEIFEMIFKLAVEKEIAKDKKISEKIQKIYESM